MSDVAKRGAAKPAPRKPRPSGAPTGGAPRRRDSNSTPILNGLKDWLACLDLAVAPSVHVNGPAYGTAFVTIDLGVVNSKKLAPEQEVELAERLRSATREVLKGRDGRIAVFRDQSNGIWWSSNG